MKYIIAAIIVLIFIVAYRARKENKRTVGEQFVTDEQIERARLDLRERDAEFDIKAKFQKH
jgi:hypothetical protein